MFERIEDMPIPEAQLRIAWLLARAYGHEWAHALATMDGELPTGITWSAQEIAQHTYGKEDPDTLTGIQAPYMEQNGPYPPRITHMTGSGRLFWRVYVDGSGTLDINRPSPIGRVLRAALAPDGTAKLIHIDAGQFFQRHVNALETALSALIGDEARAICQEARASARDGHLTREAALALEDAIFQAQYAQTNRVLSYWDTCQALYGAADALMDQPGVAHAGKPREEYPPEYDLTLPEV